MATGDGAGERRVVIFNADDFGLTAGTNAGIIGTFRRGLVRSASLMVTTPGFDDAIALARAHPDLDLGIHLALTGVRPLLAPARVPSLVDDSGRFPTLNAWLVRAFLRRLNPAEIREELRAQVVRALETGLPFSHIDGHHHTHLFAPVAQVVGELAREFGIPVVRRVADRRAVVAWLLREGRGEPGLLSPEESLPRGGGCALGGCSPGWRAPAAFAASPSRPIWMAGTRSPGRVPRVSPRSCATPACMTPR
ncbi:MAG: ChbG/HpnK family deacetylase [Thermomicrobiales bacterium]